MNAKKGKNSIRKLRTAQKILNTVRMAHQGNWGVIDPMSMAQQGICNAIWCIKDSIKEPNA